MKINKTILLYLILVAFSIFNVQAQKKPSNTALSCPEAAKYYAKDSINIVTFGASTVQGVKGFGFQKFLVEHFKNCYSGKTVDITNHGIGGETTAQGLLRINDAIKNRTGFVVVNMGINDAVAITNGKLKITETEANMRAIIKIVIAKKLIPIICTLQNVDDRESTINVTVNKHIKSLNTIYRKIASENKIYLANINGALRSNFALYQDAYHPNERGYKIISFVIFDAINKAIFDNFLQFVVTQNYPNPANTFTKLDIVLPEADKIDVQIYDIMGRLVQTVIQDYLNTGKHTLEINTTNMVPGVYFFKVSSESGSHNATKKFIVVR
ncbi:T9SS type A sorting domain-containing protein [Pedobacter changchengzhani]|uniref:T9SS type A sorting domain-containing protein n=1 Tax=Pedobacter changchengzhani TaxID=2529274 RepID=A0A4R5ML00_9SPHI|nr:SGNH/GDSL hydrolase family protein [Pedobacter changchengzhani]TDG36341.1 T9SS type A sorting domain-containing protein [Pedobacter changchengzhani]